MRRRLTVLLFVLAVAGPAGAGGVQSASAEAPALVSVVHGLRGVVADIAVDGKVVLQGFSPERSTDPLPLSAGSHALTVRRTGDAGPPVISTTMSFAAGSSTSLVAHLDPDGKPVLTAFLNDPAAIAAGNGRLEVRNAAAASSAQFLVDDKPLGGAVATDQQTAQDLPGGDHTVTVQAPTSADVLLGAQTVQVPAGATTAISLIGSPTDGSLGWLVQTIKAGAAPAGVPTGDSGLKDRHSSPAVPALLLAAAIAVAGAARRRRHP